MIRAALATTAAMLLTAGCSAAPESVPKSDAAVAAGAHNAAPMVPAGPRLRVVLMSSLPLVHGDGVDMHAMIAGKTDPHPLHEQLNAAHDLIVADSLDAAALAGADLVILVQPPALPPETLVAIDDYVRGGGKLLLFADPVLEWHSGKGLGDPLGPLRSSLMSPLLKHWGLELVDPDLEMVRLRPSGAMLVHPGRFAVLPGKTGDGGCAVEMDGHVARCRPGKGRAVLVADADLIDPAMINDSAESADANSRFVATLISDLAAKDTS